MALSERTIRINFKKTNKQADELDQMASELKAMLAGDYADTIASIRANWSGENADAYIQKCNAVNDKIQNTIKDLTNSASTLRTIAKRTYDAEMENYRIATRRTY